MTGFNKNVFFINIFLYIFQANRPTHMLPTTSLSSYRALTIQNYFDGQLVLDICINIQNDLKLQNPNLSSIYYFQFPPAAGKVYERGLFFAFGVFLRSIMSMKTPRQNCIPLFLNHLKKIKVGKLKFVNTIILAIPSF